MPDTTIPDAVWISPNFVSKSNEVGATDTVIRQVAGKLFGLKPNETGKSLTYYKGIDGGTAVRLEHTEDGFYDSVTRASRYEWKDVDGRDGLVRIGILVKPTEPVKATD